MKLYMRALGESLFRLWPSALVYGVMAAIFYLYDLSPEPFLYGLFLSGGAMLLYALLRAGAVCARASQIRRARELLPDVQAAPDAPTDICGRELLLLYDRLLSCYQTLLESGKREGREREDYYTLWVHQIKTPIAAMELLLDESGGERADDMRRELRRVEQYAEIALNYLRVESFGSDIEFARVAVKPVAQAAAKRMAAEFIHKRISLSMENVDYAVLTDAKWLLFILEQLLSNAVKYTHHGGVSISMPDENTLAISDTGIGIRPEDVPRVFERGFTGATGRGYHKSTGIGLYLCYLVANKLKIELALESQPQRGTKVTLRFPEELPEGE